MPDSVTPKNPKDRAKAHPNLVRSGTIVGLMTFLSRILGFIRDQIMAVMFGAGGVTDAFLVAWRIPNLMRKLFAEGAFAQAFVPVFADYRESGSTEDLKRLAANVSGTLAIAMLLISTVGVMLAPFIIILFAPGYDTDSAKYVLATDLLRITFPYMFFASLLAYAGSVLNTFGKFAIPSLTPVLLNICMILAALWFSPYFEQPITALAWSVLIAGVLQLIMQLPFLQDIGMLPKPRWAWKDSAVRRILKLMGPVIFGSSVAQINVMLDTVIASFLAVGSLSWLYYSDRLVQFPLGILGVALATVILPRLSSDHARAAQGQYQNTLTWAIRVTLLAGLPAAVGLLMLAKPMLATLFQYGKFSVNDTNMAAYSLIAYSFGLPAYLLVKVFLPAFFSRQNTRTPVRIGIIALLSNMVLNLLLVIPMVKFDFIAPHMALAIASTVTAWQQAIMLYLQLKRENIYQLPASQLSYCLRIVPALIAMAAIILWLTPSDFGSLAAQQRGLTLLGIITAAMAVYFGALLACGVRPSHLKAN